MTTIKLKYPLQLEGRTVDEVTLRRPKARDLKNMDDAGGGDMAKSIALISALAQLPPSAVEDLDAADFRALSEAAAGFLET